MDVMGIVMAGGRGERLYPLTRDRAKPAVPFAGKYRIIDFVLSNLVNSGIYSIYVLTQFMSRSLVEHLQEGWQLTGVLGEHFVTPVPAQMRTGQEWYRGTADAVHQNLHLIRRAKPRFVAIFGADHIYKMNIRQMLDYHKENKASVTVAAIPVRTESAGQFGVLQIDDDLRILGFEEKPPQPKAIPGEPEWTLISMGNYIFDTKLLLETLADDASRPESSHDFGRDILPRLVREGRLVYAYDFRKNHVPSAVKGEEPSYWRDVGTIEAYYEANMDIKAVDPSLNLYNRSWPIRTVTYSDAPAKFVFDDEERRGMALNSVVSEGAIISGSLVRDSVVSPNVRIHSFCLIEESVIMNQVEIGRGCRIRRAIIDKNVAIPAGTEIGYSVEEDRRRYFVSDGGIVVVAREEPKHSAF
ncbi:MAG: glucose-1-phosphate adenylyltransferase [Deltaproteobacteria bacterium RIFCSPLOWO2_12_FULL_60_19]|nr:MAG: glucose-1-phosphate adenylyltransferase [Deltaproteobacteria bacterium RIFCSPLOWO2_12_FULL_60_19]